ncbi:hypothetical protein HYC85_016313 [Camellia sinensis]|uniref:Protein kinase domain-containing protein n=1 Tax=Camellia sinensis TaxID=4442 RepID=A0A7J7H0Q2_CAMSI|nr:hypothetical protein HYC85_016313 [Camellia sinensis]
MEQYEILEQIGKGAFGSAVLVRHKDEKKKAEAIKKANGVLFSEEKLCKWLVQLLMALDYLHVNHILHRDVKVVGTPSYMCPELLADIPYGSKSDIWSLGYCIYEMTSHKPAFKAFVSFKNSVSDRIMCLQNGAQYAHCAVVNFALLREFICCLPLDMQALINKVNKSIVAPLPTKYSSAFRALIKSMLRKNPELRPSVLDGRCGSRCDGCVNSEVPVVVWNRVAAELLRHQHLQPYVLKVHLKLNSPRRNSLPTHWPQADYIKKTRFVEPEDIPVSTYKEKWHSFGNNRTLNPNITVAERDSSFSQRNQSLNKKIAELSVECIHEESDFGRKIISKASNFAMTPRLTPTKDSPTPKKQAELSKNRVSFPASPKPEKKSVHANRRASLPLPMRSNPCVGILDCIKSPDVSVNSPRIDRMVEFPLASYEDSVIPIRRISSTSAQGSSTSPQGDQSIMKDKCTVQVLERNFGRLSFGKIKLGGEDGSECSDQNATAGASSRTSSDLRRRPFDMSSYQQRAEALEGLLEFSARLLQDKRYNELGVLLKPFGPGKVSPRETAIWLTKSCKENILNPEDQYQ